VIFAAGCRAGQAARVLAMGAGLLAAVGAGATAGGLLLAVAPAPAGLIPTPRAGAGSNRSEPVLRVLLLQAQQLEPTAAGGPLRLLDGQGRLLTLLPAGERLRISRLGPVLRLERPDAEASLAPPLQLPLQELWLEPAAIGPAPSPPPAFPWRLGELRPSRYLSLLGLGRHRYRGRLQILADGERLQAVNHLPLEAYLGSVVGSEMPARWPAAALRAQAVAARTYALAQIRPSAPFDLRATVASQVYLGVAAETDSTRAAVLATRSQVLRHGGALIEAVFHSSSGGNTESSGAIWKQQLPYLVSVPDQDNLSPWRQWNLRFEPEQLRRAFRETAGANRIEVLDSSSSGRVRRARVIGPAGSLDLSGAELRQRLGLRSTLVRFRFDPPLAAAAIGAIAAAAAPQPGPADAAGSYASRYDGQPDGQPAGINASRADNRIVSRPAGPPPPPPPPAGPAAGTRFATAGANPGDGPPPQQASDAPAAPSLEVVGRGFGHGVGMSQWGAYGLALRGVGYEQILSHYYRGAQLVPFAFR
jgi:stage II sporulation protein D